MAQPEDTAGRVELVFLAQAALTPLATALEWSAGRMSYEQLRHRAQLLAEGPLSSLSAAAEELVALCLARGPALVVAVLGTLLAAGAFLPIDPTTPLLRMESMLDDAQPALVLLGEQRHEAVLRAASCVAPLVLIDSDGIVCSPRRAPVGNATAAAGSAARSAARARSGADLMYVIFTSGSTGRPKGVPTCQSALARSSPCDRGRSRSLHPLAKGHPLGPSGGLSPLGCRTEGVAALRCLPEARSRRVHCALAI